QKVRVFFPKFKMTNQFGMAPMLESMGMPDAFSSRQADFSGMDGRKGGLFIGNVIHKAFIEVDEKGTEAAAATAVVMRMTSMPAASPVFRADHPFVFVIRDNTSGSVLFMGRVSKP
ncbi:serpin family protein, partial [PVC group bacterium]|nr:serpin family protein [PVC group bacterium]